jgi:hypothetical protein
MPADSMRAATRRRFGTPPSAAQRTSVPEFFDRMQLQLWLLYVPERLVAFVFGIHARHAHIR